MGDPTYWTVEEVAERWRVSKMTVYRLCQSGKLTHARLGGSYRIPDDALKEYESSATT